MLVFLSPDNDNNYLRARIDKHCILDTTSSPKIVFVGGSNVAFGIDSRIIRDSTELNVVNTGLHAGMGIKFIMSDLNPDIKKMKKEENNYIIICPEYSHFYNEGNGEPITMAPLFVSDIKVVKLMNVAQLAMIMRGLPKYASGKIRENIENKIKNKGNRSYKNDRYRYERKGFNEYGDEINHITLKSDHPQIIANKMSNTDINENTLSYFLNTIKIWEKHAHVLIIPPALYDEVYKLQEVQIKQISDRLAKSGNPFMMPTDSFKYDKSMMYNTGYHLNAKGTKNHSRKIATFLKNFLEQQQ